MEVGSNVLICGGSRPHLVGARAMVLPAASGAASSHTVVLTDNRHDRRGRVLTMDTANLQLAARRHLLGDDGMNVPLRWLLYPPPLTRFTARWLLGWSSYSTVVPEKPLHRDQLRALQRAQEAKAAAEPPKEARVKLQPRDKSRLAPAESSTTGSASSRPGCETSEASATSGGTPLPPTSDDGFARKGPARFRRGQLPSPPTTRWMEHHQLRAGPSDTQKDKDSGREARPGQCYDCCSCRVRNTESLHAADCFSLTGSRRQASQVDVEARPPSLVSENEATASERKCRRPPYGSTETSN